MERTGLPVIRIASPCHEAWHEMEGDERVRHCRACRMNVYNLRELSDNEARTLITQAEGRVCLRLFRRPDGTIITKDCPVGISARRRMHYLGAAFLACFALAFHYLSNNPPACRKSTIDFHHSLDRLMTLIFGEEDPPPTTGVMMRVE